METRFIVSVIIVGSYEERLDSTVVPIAYKTFEEAVKALKEEALEAFEDTSKPYTMEELDEICEKQNIGENRRVFLENLTSCTYCLAINQIYI